MDVRTGTSSPAQVMAWLRVVPDGVDAEALTSSLKDSYLIGPGLRALAAYERVSASMVRGI